MYCIFIKVMTFAIKADWFKKRFGYFPYFRVDMQTYWYIVDKLSQKYFMTCRVMGLLYA
jgi:hypothetical protein